MHRRCGQVFTVCMLLTGGAAIGISVCALIDPMGTHPQLVSHPVFQDSALVSAIFGWMMLGLAILTINLAWYGWLCNRNRRDHAANLEWRNLTLQAATSSPRPTAHGRATLLASP